MELIQKYSSAFLHERNILKICGEKNLSKVVKALDGGEVKVPGIEGINGQVYYLIFEMANSDIRMQVDTYKRLDTIASLAAIKDVCLGLWQVHRQMIAHQDAKPSNILIFGDEFKIADFGRSTLLGTTGVFDEQSIAGDTHYAPPELIYGFKHEDFKVRRVGCDLYLLGNLIAFMFTGVNVTAAIFSRLDRQFYPVAWQGQYQQILPQIQEAFTSVLEDLRSQIEPFLQDAIVKLVSELCNPDVKLRGHPKGIGKYNQYSLERYDSALDVLANKASIQSKLWVQPIPQEKVVA